LHTRSVIIARCKLSDVRRIIQRTTGLVRAYVLDRFSLASEESVASSDDADPPNGELGVVLVRVAHQGSIILPKRAVNTARSAS
jgi:hypothetical protein